MRLRSISVSKKEKNDKLRKKFRGKKKHKRLDAICENDHSRSHKGDQKVEFSEIANGDKEMELRRSKRCRRTPVILDSSPMPPKKRRKFFKSMSNIDEKDSSVNGVDSEMQPSCSRDFNGQHPGWKLSLRSRGKSRYSSRKEEVQFAARSKRNLFANVNDFRDAIVTENGNKEELATDKSTIVKSKRPGRIKASKIMANGELNIGLEDNIGNGDEKTMDLLLEKTCVVENELVCRSDTGAEAGNTVLVLAEQKENAVERGSIIEGSDGNGAVKGWGNCIRMKNAVPDQGNCAEVDQDMPNLVKHDAYPDKPVEELASTMPDGEFNKPAVLDGKPTISLGRRCGLCGCGDDGKPPKVMLDGACSDNEEYSRPSASEEPNYDVWDGFGDQASWLGQLLGPIIDRFGIAGIWVHQQCAVWSPEVYFSGLGCLKNVRAALCRGRMLKCSRCGRAGATIGCRVDQCPKTYHLPCARDRGCIFDHRKFLIACYDHRQLFRPHGVQNTLWLKKMKTKKMKLELLKNTNNAYRKDVEAEEKMLENYGEDEEFLKRESKRLHRDLIRIAPTYIGGNKPEDEKKFQGWESVAGLKNVIQCLKEVVILPLLYPEFFSNLGIVPPRGVLLHGHPGTGKTLVLRALIGSCARGDTRIAYFARKGADCLGKYVGDAERQLRLLFQVAEKSQPSIIIFDEIDGLAPCRTKRQDQTHNSVVSTLLALMDGLKSRGSVIVIGTTNRPDSVDPALRRPGRFDREIYFPLPSIKDREAILSLHTEKWPRPVTGFLLKWVARKTVGFAGADLQALCTQAVTIALRRSFPLQKVLSEAETGTNIGKRLAIPKFFVEEEDWLKALSCSPPPCSKRESGVALNDVTISPLKLHLFSCLLLPLTRLLLFLQLDGHVWLPKHLYKASSLVKSVVVSTLDRRTEQSDKWWLHMDGLLHETDVMNEIERKLLLETALVEEGDVCLSDDVQETVEELSFKMSSPSPHSMGTHQHLLRNMPSQTSQKSGFHLLLCGNPRSGQRHLASCILHCFVGSLDFWKIDLASIFVEGHGDAIHGLRQSLMRCAGANLCLLYMPRLDLWAVETVGVIFEYESLVASYLWTSFLELVESISVNTSLIILATSDLPYQFLPDRIREFFGDEIMKCGVPNTLVSKLPRFSVQLDGKFDQDSVITSFAAKLSKDLVQQMVHSHHVDIHEKPPEGKVYDIIHSDDNSACHIKSPDTSPSIRLGFGNKALKGKTSLQIAIATFGYQILMFPHFAELCWVTSKLKEGPSSKADGPWKGWPFNSCIVRPIQSTEDVATPGPSNIKSKEPGLVHGLVAVGLRAYKGEYTSLKKVCCEVRKVLETLVRRIDEKVHAGKNQVRFFRILSQVAYLDDMVTGMAHAFQGLDMENADIHASEANANGDLRDDQIVNDGGTDAHGEGQNTDSSKVTAEKINLEVQVSDGSFLEPSNADNGVKDTGVKVEDALMEDAPQDPLDGSDCPNIQTTESGPISPAILSNGFADISSYMQSDGPAVASDYQHCGNIVPPVVNGDQSSDHSSKENSSSSKDLCHQTSNSSTCYYQCCPDCFANLHRLLLRILDSDIGHSIRSISNIEDLHDVLSAFSAHLHLDLSKLLLGESTPVETPSGSGKSCEHPMITGKMVKECYCVHETSVSGKQKADLLQQQSLRFVFNNGVLSSLEAGSNISYDCKFEKLCLCYLIEWLGMRRRRKGVS